MTGEREVIWRRMCDLHAMRAEIAERSEADPAACDPAAQDPARNSLAGLRAEIVDAEQALSELVRAAPFTVPDADMLAPGGAGRHRRSCWMDEAFEEARTELFLQACALNALMLRANAPLLKRSFWMLRGVLNGQFRVDGHTFGRAMQTLLAITPVVSTSLASVRRLAMRPDLFGLAIIDEAGQATPQSVLGLAQRSSRLVMVGDPLQIEPVMTTPQPVVERLQLLSAVPERFSLAGVSAQSVADAVSLRGAWIGGGETPVWSGHPLRLHRRCDDPMFSIANAIAYDGQMVHGSGSRPEISCALVETDPARSVWIDVRGLGGDKVVAEEIAALDAVLRGFKRRWPTIGGPSGEPSGESSGDLSGSRAGKRASVFVISPFVAVATAARETAWRVLGRDHRIICPTGTVHTFQGREADIVVIMLGSAPGERGRGSRSWAAARPNLLNVALTRARRRVIVIGSHEDWSMHPYFRTLADRFYADGSVLRLSDLGGATHRREAVARSEVV